METCLTVGKAAEEADEDAALVLSLAWYESRFVETAESSKGAVGPLQVIPGYWCPNRTRVDCDYVQAGLNALRGYRDIYGDNLVEVLCHYNAGNKCGKRAYNYARKVLRRRSRLKSFQ